MARISKKAIEARIDRLVSQAIRGLQIPILQTPAIYKLAQQYATADASDAVTIDHIRDFAIRQGATVVS